MTWGAALGGGDGDRQIHAAPIGSGGVAASEGESDGGRDGNDDGDSEPRRVMGTVGGGEWRWRGAGGGGEDGNSGPDPVVLEADPPPPRVYLVRGELKPVAALRSSWRRRPRQRRGAHGHGGDSGWTAVTAGG